MQYLLLNAIHRENLIIYVIYKIPGSFFIIKTSFHRDVILHNIILPFLRTHSLQISYEKDDN